MEMIVVTDIGPRIMSFRLGNGPNILYEDKTGFSVGDWQLYGGHRFATAPETTKTYEPDNQPCQAVVGGQLLRISGPPGCGAIQKIMEISHCRCCDGFKVRHILRNTGGMLWPAAPWAITCVKPIGRVVAQWGSGTGKWRTNMVRYWSQMGSCGTCANSRQWQPGNDIFVVQPSGETGKIGLYTDQGWMALLAGELTFIKRFQPVVRQSLCPDGGCNIEIYTCSNYIEMETLGAFETICPDAEITHTECWKLSADVFEPDQFKAVSQL